jgi:hypothetical protein
MRGSSNGLPNVTNLDLGPKIQLRIRRQVSTRRTSGFGAGIVRTSCT